MSLKLETTTKRQNTAANPQLSAWLSANAGSGKTHVLINRVIRILLAGTQPHKILCLTFTKTAAAEMQNRLFKTLSNWAVLDDEKLINEISNINDGVFKPEALNNARRLFAEALETSGGLKIQTIHAFCERILHSFPIEAGISPQFEVIDDRSASEMLLIIKRNILNQAQDINGRFGNSMSIISQYSNEEQFDNLINGLIKNRQKISKLIGYDFADTGFEDAPMGSKIGKLGKVLNLDKLILEADNKGVDVYELYQAILTDKTQWPMADFKEFSLILKEVGGKSNVKQAEIFDAAINSTDIEKYFDIFFTKARTPKAKLFYGDVKNFTNICQRIEDEKLKAIVKYEKLSAVKLYQASIALFEIGNAILWKFVQEKQNKNMVDYDDLINITAKLLNGKTNKHKGQTAWVLYKLDNGLEHILIDEAQDTSPQQWSVIEPLVNEITANSGSNDTSRSLFVVGDDKQSIYKFQGADRDEFKHKEKLFEQSFKTAQLPWERIGLDLSFRSAPCILEAVDRVFSFEQAAKGVYDETIDNQIKTRHFAHRNVGGIVELWDVEQGVQVDVPNAWRAPVDEPSPVSPSRMLADKIANKIALWLKQNRLLKSKNRPIKPSDILILVRRRNDFVNALIRALKSHNIPVAGIDRMRVNAELIVEDMLALGKFCLLPEDEFTLSIILKSPLIGIDDDDLFKLAYDRKTNLWQALKAAKSPKWQSIYERLNAWLKLSKTLRPFDFYMQVLSANGGRKKLISRLGADAHDPLDEFLNLVENFELNHTPDLSQLLIWIENDKAELKREIDGEKNEVRIMTVHGAKGLESNIVILPDTYGLPQKGRGEELAFQFGDESFAYWRPNKDTEPNLVKQIKSDNYIKEIEEYHRLLYVAMTRAGDELYIAGYSKKLASEKAEFYNWHQLVEQAFTGWAEPIETDDGHILRYETSGDVEQEKDFAPRTLAKTPLPKWAISNASRSKPNLRALSPSTLLASNESDFSNLEIRFSPLENLADNRFLRGNLIHKLLENLPKINANLHSVTTKKYLEKHADVFSAQMLKDIATEVEVIMKDSRFALIFSQNSQSEISIVGEIVCNGKTKLISGQIDRLIVDDKQILILDYKSNRPPPTNSKDVSKQYLGQMAAYRALLQQTHPNHTIKTAILWTFTAQLMPLSSQQLDEAYTEIFNQTP